MQPLSEKNNFLYLASALILLLFIGSLMEYAPGQWGPRLVQAATVAMLVLSTWTTKGSRSRFVINIAFGLGIFLLALAGALLDVAGLGFAHLFLMLCFFVWATWMVACQVLFTGAIDGNKIVGAICIYMLLGLIWSMLYLFIAEAVPDAFNGLPQGPWLENFSSATYFSFVTITTLGFGDISPVLPLARFLVFMEAIVGVFYMAILVASLVGVRMADRGAAPR